MTATLWLVAGLSLLAFAGAGWLYHRACELEEALQDHDDPANDR